MSVRRKGWKVSIAADDFLVRHAQVAQQVLLNPCLNPPSVLGDAECPEIGYFEILESAGVYA